MIIDKRLFYILVVVCAISAINWLLYDQGKNLIDMVSKNDSRVSSMLYKVIGICGIGVLGILGYNHFINKDSSLCGI